MRPCVRERRPEYLSTSAAKPRRILKRCRSLSASESMSSASRRRGLARCVSRSGGWTSEPLARPPGDGYSTSPLTQLVRAASASGASSPSALSRRVVPPCAPSASTARMLLASATFPSVPTVTRARKRKAVFTNVAGGRACSAPPAGRTTVDSELAGTARFLCRPCHVLERLPRRRHDRRRHRPFDERGVDQAHVSVRLALEQVANCEDGAAEVGQHHDPLAGVGTGDRLSHRIAVRAERPVRAPARGLDLDLAARHLGSEGGGAPPKLAGLGDR